MINTSIQYQISNSILPRRVFLKGQEFIDTFMKGEEALINSIIYDWNNTKNILSKSIGFNVKDIDKQIRREDIEIYVDGDPETEGFMVITIKFPEYLDVDGTCNIVGIYLTNKPPRYFTLKNAETSGKRKAYVFGEIVFVTEEAFDRKEYEYTTNGNLENFIDLVIKHAKKLKY